MRYERGKQIRPGQSHLTRLALVPEGGFCEIGLRQRVFVAQGAPRTYTQFAVWTVMDTDLG